MTTPGHPRWYCSEECRRKAEKRRRELAKVKVLVGRYEARGRVDGPAYAAQRRKLARLVAELEQMTAGATALHRHAEAASTHVGWFLKNVGREWLRS